MTMQSPAPDHKGRTALLYARLIDPGTGLDETGGQVPSGVYMARMTAAGRSYTRSLRLVR